MVPGADDLASWLEQHGLVALASRLAAHDIDLDVLAQLSDADLKEAGLSLGERRRVQLALRADAEKEERPPLPQNRGPERRRLTVVFIDLVGSTALAARHDPEVLRDLIRAFQDATATEIARFDGHLANFLGDGILAYFGWPNAHEDDAERAILASRAILQAIERICEPGAAALAGRAGIATGEVVIEDGTGRGISGETPNLAARLQDFGKSGDIVVAETTCRLVAGLFDFDDLGEHAIKELAGSQPVFRVAGERLAASRFQARHTDQVLASMVGRERELAALLGAWERANSGGGNLVLVAGEAGIGKSRLLTSFERRLSDREHLHLRYQCSPFHSFTPLWPVIEQLTHAARLHGVSDPQERLVCLRTLLAPADADDGLQFEPIADLLGLMPQADRPAALPPSERKRRLFAALAAQLEALAARAPILMIVEDAHWIDPTTSELLGQIFMGLQRLRVLALVTFRPEYRPPWRECTHATRLDLEPLSGAAAYALVAGVAPNLPERLMRDIVDKADGVPLFIEEIARSFAERPSPGVMRDMPPVPASLHDTLMARLDRLGGARRVAQIGAAIGRDFRHDLLARCAQLPVDRLATALTDLVGSGLVAKRGTGPDMSYQFKHALVQDAAYHSLLRSQRREIHACIADNLAVSTEATEPALMAHHLTEAGRTGEAIDAWGSAARLAVPSGANCEAVQHLDYALMLLTSLPDTAEREYREHAVRLEQAVALIALHGFGSDEVARCAARVLDLAKRCGDDRQRFASLRVAWNSALMREPLSRAVAMAEELMRQAKAAGEAAWLAVAHRALGYSLCMSGRHREALQVFDAGALLADQVGDDAFVIFGEHPGILCRVYGAWSHAVCDDQHASETRADAAVALARRLGNPHGLAWALVCAGVPAVLRRDHQRARAFETEALKIAQSYNLPQWVGFSSGYLGWALHASGERESGLAAITAGYEMVRGTGAVLNTTILLWARADRWFADSKLAEAADDIDKALAHAESHGEMVILPELLALAGDITKKRGGDPRPLWLRGIKAAREQGSRLYEQALDRRQAD